MSQASPKPTTRQAPVVVLREKRSNYRDLLRLFPAALLSALFHTALIGLLFLLSSPSQAEPALEKAETPVQADPPEEKGKSDPFLTTDVDPAAQDIDTDINYNLDRKSDVSVPGIVNPNEMVGIENASKDAPPTNLPAPLGLGQGQGGALKVDGVEGNGAAIGMAGGYNLKGMPLAGTFYGRSGGTREKALRDGGGTGASEAAVTRGLQWLARVQHPEGKWQLDGDFADKGSRTDDIAGTAFGLLPMLGAGKTHKPAKDNPYDKPIEKALAFLKRKQDQRTGFFGSGMYSHGLATIAVCEAYGLTQDPQIRKMAQLAINFIVSAQHSAGGWRYSPGQAGDTSVVGWQVMALKSGQMAGLDVPESTMRKAIQYLDTCVDTGSEGYGYTGPNPTYTMTAVGLLCRQYLQSWGPQNIRMITGIDRFVKPNAPGKFKNMYYYYYATQVLHHFGGQTWKDWNEKMREQLIKTQETRQIAENGSWSGAGEAHGAGRLYMTSLCLLTLEVYYRHLPLYYRDAGEMANNMAK